MFVNDELDREDDLKEEMWSTQKRRRTSEAQNESLVRQERNIDVESNEIEGQHRITHSKMKGLILNIGQL